MITMRSGVRRGEIRHGRVCADEIFVADEFGRAHGRQHVGKPCAPVFARIFVHAEFSRADVRPRKPERVPPEIDGGKIIRRFFVEDVFLNQRAGGDHTHDVAFQHSFRRRGVGELFADGDPETRVYESADVIVDGVVRHAAHRRAFVLHSAVASRQRKVEHAGSGLRVVEKHFVKIAQPEKQQTVGIVRFDFEISLHHRREFAHVNIHKVTRLCVRTATRNAPR